MSDTPGSDAGSTPKQTATVVCSDSTTLAQDKRRWKNLLCPHCDQVSKMFYRHKRTYYDRRSKRWATGSNLDREVSSSDEDGSGQSVDQDPPTSIEGVTTVMNWLYRTLLIC